jgi:hypothetical protein
MLHTMSRATRALGVATVSIGLATMGLVIASSGPASAQSTPPALDHFLCYQSRYSGPKAPPRIVLRNVIQPSFVPSIGAANLHCNPANKLVGKALFRVKNPLGHLLCYQLVSKFTPVHVLLTTQFGQALMFTGSTPSRLCLPTWKSNIGPPNQPVSQPPKLDHFTCYPVSKIAGVPYFKIPASVRAEDEFSAPKYTALKLGTANQLCVPTTKILPTGLVYKPQAANDLSLVCFPTSPTPFWKLIYDQNQFGESIVSPTTANEEFCVPSTVSNQGP